ncbi:carbon monoxide dehydrogenase subunit G [Streptacidiphilus sp. MAP12-20]|uniref:SRPBCC domain-containing protein n=1 Tax=Streptacidiphilus sp. MAP12-20 TaxID=3156299 RepID=UPI00351870D0
MEHEVLVPLPPQALRRSLDRPELLAACLPGFSLDEGGGVPLTGRLKLRVGGSSITYRGEARRLDGGPADYAFALDGEQSVGTGSVAGTVRLRLAAAADDSTRVTFLTSLQAKGRVEELPPEALETAARRLLDRFCADLAAAAAGRDASGASADAAEPAEAEPPAASGAPGASAPAHAAEPAADGGEVDGFGDAEGEEGADSGAPGAAAAADAAEPAADGGEVDGCGGAEGEELAAAAEPPAASGAPGAAAPGDRAELAADGEEAGGFGDADGEGDLQDAADFEELEQFGELAELAELRDLRDLEALGALEEAGVGDPGRRSIVGRSAEEVDHAPPRGRYAPALPARSARSRASARWGSPERRMGEPPVAELDRPRTPWLVGGGVALIGGAVILVRALRRSR